MDTIADMLTQIRNAQLAGKAEIIVPFSKIKMAIAKILEDKNYIKSARKETEENVPKIRIILKYEKIGANKSIPAISEITRISKLGKRIYAGKNEIKKVKNGFGISIISTSRGVMTGDEAKKLGVGGEMICEVW